MGFLHSFMLVFARHAVQWCLHPVLVTAISSCGTYVSIAKIKVGKLLFGGGGRRTGLGRAAGACATGPVSVTAVSLCHYNCSGQSGVLSITSLGIHNAQSAMLCSQTKLSVCIAFPLSGAPSLEKL